MTELRCVTEQTTLPANLRSHPARRLLVVFSVLTNFYSSFKTSSHVTCSEAFSDSLPKENSCLPPLFFQSTLLRALFSLLAGHCVLSFYGSLSLTESGAPQRQPSFPHSHASPPSPDGRGAPHPSVWPLPPSAGNSARPVCLWVILPSAEPWAPRACLAAD